MSDPSDQGTPVRMVRPDLERLPDHPVPEDVRVSWFAPGDGATWIRLYASAEPYLRIDESLFDDAWHGDHAALRERMCFFRDADGAAVATASAWYDDEDFRLARGRVHWVAVAPSCQGRGLSKPLMSVVLRRMRDLGHESAYLSTSEARLPAVALYARFGFVPDIRSDEEDAAWKRIRAALGDKASIP